MPLALTAQFSDDFSDGDFTTGPAWSGSAAVFQVNPSGQLQTNDVVAATSYLSAAHGLASLNDVEWRFWVRQAFAGSGSNFGRVYLASDQADLTAPLNGYFLQFGEAGSNDAVELFEQTGSTITSVCRGTEAAIASSFTIGVRVTRDALGGWSVLVDPAGGTAYALQATGTDATHGAGTHLGVRCTYTVSNATNFLYDDFFAGTVGVDTEPPVAIAVEVLASTAIDVRFNEPVEEVSANATANYAVTPGITVTAAVRDASDQARVHLTLSPALVNGADHVLSVDNVEDLAGNAMTEVELPFTYVVPEVAGPGDVVINEIMADPSPAVELPEVEFIEIVNTTPSTFDLEGWTISDGGTPATLPALDLPPNAHAILCSTTAAPFLTDFGTVLAVPGFPSLNNDGDPLELRSADAAIIDAVSYVSAWYNDPLKEDGGWTLERIDPDLPCSNASNWTASIAPAGGTPGAQNSVFADIVDDMPPAVVGAQVIDEGSIRVLFNEPMDVSSLLFGLYTITPGVAVSAAIPEGSLAVVLELATPLVVGQMYTITVDDVADCPGNPIGAANTALFALPEDVTAGDVVINEVLYDPRSGGSDFVELYNRSQKTLDLSGWKLANMEAGVIDDALPITASGFLLLPGTYALITEDAANINTSYPRSHADRFVETDMPSYNNGEGTVVLLGPDDGTLDLFTYSDDLHFELLNSTEGISLERVSPERPASDGTNWHSAAEDAGWATPGYVNSQFAVSPAPTGELTIDPAIFSPDNDGHQDLLTLTYRFDQPGFTATLKIFDVAGREVRTLLNNELLGTSGSISWDGIMDTNEKARMGPYVVYLEAYDLEGNVEKFRETVVLAHRLD